MSPKTTDDADTTRAGRILRVFARLEKAHPDARLALDFASPFELLIALILAAQCTDERVNRLTRALLFHKYRGPEDYARADTAELENDIRPSGFFRSKARSIQGCCRHLIQRFGGEVPRTLEELVSLPGVGRKTANILLGNAFGQPAIGVDTHIMRLAKRLGFTRHGDPDKIEAELTAITPRPKWIRLCHLLQAHGRRVCAARKPACHACVVAADCPFPDKTPRPEARVPRPAFGRKPGERIAPEPVSQAAKGRKRLSNR